MILSPHSQFTANSAPGLNAGLNHLIETEGGVWALHTLDSYFSCQRQKKKSVFNE